MQPAPPDEELAARLAVAFPGESIDAIAPLPGGRSGAAVHLVTIAGKAWVLRHQAANHGAPLTCLRIASERGIAPAIRYLDEEAGIVVMEHIVAVPRQATGLARIAQKLRHLHDGPALPGTADVAVVLTNIDAILARRGGALPPEVVANVKHANALCRRFAASAPCHNDLNPGNILEAADATYFVDWDTAAMNDPFFDLGCLGVFRFATGSERSALLVAYLGREPTAEERARAVVTRVLATGFYAAAFQMMSATGKPVAPTLTLSEVLGSFRKAPVAFEIVAAAMAAEQAEVRASPAYAEAGRLLS